MEVPYSNCSDMWRAGALLSPVSRPDPGRTHGDIGACPSLQRDFDAYLSMRPPSPVYKELPPMKERGSSDIADALLSLKHAVVRPSMNGQMSPLSPGFSHLAQSLSPHGPCPGGGLAPSMGGHGQGLVTYGHSLQYNPQCGMDNITTNTTGTQTQTNMFPSMSVNVSMSMNVGMPQANFQDPWGAPAPQGYAPTQCPRPPSPNIHVQTNYPAYSPPNQAYCGGYGIPDTREVDHGDMYYRTACEEPQYQSVSRLYSFHAQLRRSKPPTPTGMMAPDHAKINLCRICGKTYARPSTLKTHLRTHSGEKPYKCSTCGKSFSQAANLTAHLRTHSGEKPFRCPVCDRRFSQSSSVTTHMRTHSGERPYRCRLCKKAFSDSSTLTKHLRIHSGEKPYQCKLCLLRFSQSGNLNRHMRIHNNSNA